MPDDSDIEDVDDLTAAMKERPAGRLDRRRLGRRRRADPGRPDRPGARRRTRPTSTTSRTPAAARPSPPCSRQRDHGRLRHLRGQAADRRRLAARRSPCPARSGVDILPDVPTLKEEGVDVVRHELARRRRAAGHHRRAGAGAGGPDHGHDRDRRVAGGARARGLGRRRPGRPGVRGVPRGRDRAHQQGRRRPRRSGRSRERRRPTTGTSRSTSAASWSAPRRPSGSTSRTTGVRRSPPCCSAR